MAAAVLSTAALSAASLAGAPAARAATCPSPSAGSVAEAVGPVDVDVVVRGHGWGHSLGMSQYGAQGAALLGCSASKILTTYYTGAKLTSVALHSAVILDLLAGGSRGTVAAETGTVTWTAPGTTQRAVQPQGATWTVTKTSTAQVVTDAGGKAVITVPFSNEVRAIETGHVVRITGYGAAAAPALRTRWDYTRFVSDSSGLTMRQVIEDNASGAGVQKYLWGLAEVPVSWPVEALKAQSIAARTYLAGRWNSASGAYVIGTTQATQVYTGYAHELDDATYRGHWRDAVNATAGQLLRTSTGGPLTAMYTSSHGGWSEDYRYVYGSDVPYLRAVDDSAWDKASSNPYRSWSQGRTLASLASAFGLDSVAAIEVAPQGSTARWAGVTVHGTRAGLVATRTVDGAAVRSLLGVRSPAVTFRLAPQTLVGDWDGDGRSDVGWYDNGRVTLSVAGKTVRFTLGRPGDRAVAGDWNGDGKDTLAIFRLGQWYLCSTLAGGTCGTTFRYGTASDLPVVGRWPGAARDGVGVVRGNQWLLRMSAAGGAADTSFQWGLPTDTPVVGDWDGDGFDTPGERRGGVWYLANRLAPALSDARASYGAASDKPAVGDWNGDRRDSLGVARAGTTFYLRDDLRGGPAERTVSFSR
ncbi:SpoIID/LytB domain-containing protein [Angustibacter sp. Root456]|uniref:SpoIID/LytB domain-containing protein n=1 Tax=Angustibacter sp. Root456 TaxID=1736539 RepID=UPI0006FEFD47|nr:SpoIID/LytB domain-containing protein [Angustibacter sp. Root456]KQX69915.1 hypothetical protein ASD06_02630 [Angustibacter sp. Root456]